LPGRKAEVVAARLRFCYNFVIKYKEAFTMNLADRIQHLRKSKGISQEELADKIGVSRQAVSKWESEQSLPDIDKVILLSDYFETTTDFLLKGIEPAQEGEKRYSAMVFSLAATVLNAIGLTIALVIWIERQTAFAAGLGLVVMLLGTGLFLAGQFTDTTEKLRARRFFLLPNVWILLFIPLSCCFNILRSFWANIMPVNSLPAFGLFWMLYIALCVAADIFILKKVPGERQ